MKFVKHCPKCGRDVDCTVFETSPNGADVFYQCPKGHIFMLNLYEEGGEHLPERAPPGDD